MKWGILVLVVLLSLVFNVYLVTQVWDIQILKKSPVSKETESSEYPFLSKRIFVDEPNDSLINFSPLRAALNEYLEKYRGRVKLYFEYLPSGVTIGIDDAEELYQASLFKVPVVMAVYKRVLLGKVSMEQMLVVEEKDIDLGFGDLGKKGIGTELSVSEAIRLALTESDNTAMNVLIKLLPEGSIEDVFYYLDISGNEKSSGLTISPRDYASIFRSLYLASYLPKKESNEILDILTQTKFLGGLMAGVLGDTKVSHKIAVLEKDGFERVRSDCGIVYLPKRPYFLCLMVSGGDEIYNEVVPRVSKMVSSYVSKVNSAGVVDK